jgi:Tol biopolymer transport system component
VGIAESRGSTRIGLWKMNLDGSNKQQVTRGGYDRAPSWAPAR